MKEKVEVNKSVNLNVNQADLVEVLMEDLKEKLEGEIDKAKEELKQLEGKRVEIKAKIESDVLNRFRDPFLTELQDLLDSHKKGHKLSVAFYGGHNTDKSPEYKHLNSFDHLCETRRGGIDDYTRSQTVYSLVYKTGSIQLRSTDNSLGYDISNFPLTKKESRAEEFEKLAVQEAQIRNRLYDAQVGLVNLSRGDKRFKARFIKAGLAKSTEGKAILDMLEVLKKGTKLLK